MISENLYWHYKFNFWIGAYRLLEKNSSIIMYILYIQVPDAVLDGSMFYSWLEHGICIPGDRAMNPGYGYTI